MKPHPWLQPRSRRIAVIVICLIWLALETWNAPGTLWFWLILCLTGYGIWDFFLSGNYRSEQKS